MTEGTVLLNDGAKALPPGWQWVRLGEVCDNAEIHDPRLSANIPFRYIDISSVDSNSKRIIEYRTILGKDAPSRARQLVKANDVLIATTRPNLNAIALVPTELEEVICSTGFCVLRPTTMIAPVFLFFYAQTRDFVDTLSGKVRGMLYPAVTNNQVRSMSIPLPPLPEQKRIAGKVQELMTEAEHARTACEKQLEAAKALPSAYLRQVFESEEAKKWEIRRLGEVCDINVPRPKDFKRLSDAPTTFVPMSAVDERTGTVTNSEIRPYSKVCKGYTYFEEGDVLFAKITPCMQNGKHAIAKNLIDGMGFGTTEFHVLRPKSEVLPEWIHSFIRRPSFLQEATAYFTGAVGQQRVPETFLASYAIPLPPLPVQQHIAAELTERMAQVEKLRNSIERQLEAINALPQAILRKAFRREL